MPNGVFDARGGEKGIEKRKAEWDDGI